MEKTIKKGIKEIDFYIKQFVDCGEKDCLGCKSDREVLLEEINRYTIEILKAQNKELEERKSHIEESIYNKCLNELIEENNEIINNLSK